MSDQVVLNAALKAAGLTLARTERMSGTGASTTIRVTGILKVSKFDSETTHLQRISELLGEDYTVVFPRFRLVGMTYDGQFVTELEYLGDATLELVLLQESLALGGVTPRAFVDGVSALIGRMASVRPPYADDSCRHSFMVELLVGLGINAKVSDIPVPSWTADERLARAEFVPCLCHRDLSTGNVMCAPDGSVRLIDPRPSVSGTNNAWSTPYGSAAIDAAAFLVSLERKELERAQFGLPALGLADRFYGTVVEWMSGGLFNELMFGLCIAHAYSVYTACRCDYCLAPERKWLYDHMRERFEEASRRIV